jgi:fatty-acyl-CoA synthase
MLGLEMTSKLTKSYYNAGNSSPVNHTIPEFLDIRGTQQPEKEAFVILEIGKPRQAITFGELKTKTEQLAAGMIKRGLEKGDPVGLLCSTSLEYAICEYALARTGAILMRFHVSFRTGDDIKYMLRKGNCRWLIAHPGAEDTNYNILRSIIPSLADHDPSVKLAAEDLPDLETIFIMSSSSFPGMVSWNTLFCEMQDGDLDLLQERQATISMDDILGCYATSGSTGVPKLVAQRHSYGVNMMRSMVLKGGVDATDRFILDRPMPYAGGCSGHVPCIGLTMVYVLADARQANGRELYFGAIDEERCTVMLCFPYLLRDLIEKVDNGELNVSRIKCSFTGGEIVQQSLIQQAVKRLPSLVIGYGCTEAGAPFGGSVTLSMEQRLNYTGLGYDGELKIVDDQGTIVPVNTPGELCVRNQYLLLKYWGDEERTRQQKDALGWYKTDDMAVMNEDGFITILGRRQTVISKATIKIYPVSIEKELLLHPLVANVVAVGIPHEIVYEEICVCVVLKPNVVLTVEEIRQYCKEKFLIGDIGEGLMPDHILLFEEFPTGSTDKIDRKKTREIAIARLTK